MPTSSFLNQTSQSAIKIYVLLITSLVFLIIPLKVSSFGYLPPDDALRHVAYAVDNRNWSEVLLIDENIRPEMDSHPGWHAMLRWLNQTIGLDKSELVVFSFCVAFAGVGLIGLVASGSPIAWMFACVIILLFEQMFYSRLLLGRPFSVSIMALIALLFIWTRENPLKKWAEYATTLVLLTISIIVHPSVWYLWGGPLLVLLYCRKLSSAIIFSSALISALFLAALLTQSWYNIVTYPIIHLWHALGQDPLLGIHLVSEFQPTGAPFFVLLPVSALLTIQHFKGYDLKSQLQKPDLILMTLMWILGLSNARFWSDWGIPAFLVWTCNQIKLLQFDKLPNGRSIFTAATATSIILFLTISSDAGGRYTQVLKSPILTKPTDEYINLLPTKGGILYCTDMTVFYRLYYRLPNEGFKFTVGFEPGMMPEKDLKTLRTIQFNDGLIESYKPWLDQMTASDRILLYYPYKPEWPGIQFDRFYSAWIGRLAPAKKEAQSAIEPTPSLK